MFGVEKVPMKSWAKLSLRFGVSEHFFENLRSARRGKSICRFCARGEKTKFLFGRYLVATFEMSCIVSG